MRDLLLMCICLTVLYSAIGIIVYCSCSRANHVTSIGVLICVGGRSPPICFSGFSVVLVVVWWTWCSIFGNDVHFILAHFWGRGWGWGWGWWRDFLYWSSAAFTYVFSTIIHELLSTQLELFLFVPAKVDYCNKMYSQVKVINWLVD